MVPLKGASPSSETQPPRSTQVHTWGTGQRSDQIQDRAGQDVFGASSGVAGQVGDVDEDFDGGRLGSLIAGRFSGAVTLEPTRRTAVARYGLIQLSKLAA